MIYHDNAATSLFKPKGVEEAMITALRKAGNASRGVNEESLKAAREIYGARVSVCKLFNAYSPKYVVFTRSITESLNIVIQGMFKDGDHVITTAMEHNSVLRPIYYMESKGVEHTFLGLDEKGNISLDELVSSIRPETKALIVTHASNVTGNVNDIKGISTICRDKGVLVILDCAQTAGFLDIDMQELGVDVLCFTGHKSLGGPQGSGGLCIKPGLDIKPLLFGGTGNHSFDKGQPDYYPEHLEAGTMMTPAIAGLHAAVDYLLENGLEANRKKEIELSIKFYKGIKDIAGVTVYGDFEKELRAPIVTFSSDKLDSSYIADMLSENYGIAVRAGAHCAPLVHEHFKTMESGMVRFSFSHGNTEDEVEIAIKAVKKILEEN